MFRKERTGLGNNFPKNKKHWSRVLFIVAISVRNTTLVDILYNNISSKKYEKYPYNAGVRK